MNMNDETIPPALRSAIDRLGETLLRAEPVANYRRAEARLMADGQTLAMLQKLTDLQTDLRRGQGNVTTADIDHLRHLQQEALSNPTIAAYADGQQNVIAYLREINQHLSQLLGLDFSALARRGGC